MAEGTRSHAALKEIEVSIQQADLKIEQTNARLDQAILEFKESFKDISNQLQQLSQQMQGNLHTSSPSHSIGNSSLYGISSSAFSSLYCEEGDMNYGYAYNKHCCGEVLHGVKKYQQVGVQMEDNEHQNESSLENKRHSNEVNDALEESTMCRPITGLEKSSCQDVKVISSDKVLPSDYSTIDVDIASNINTNKALVQSHDRKMVIEGSMKDVCQGIPQNMNIILLNPEQANWFNGKFSGLGSEEKILTFEYEKITDVEIEPLMNLEKTPLRSDQVPIEDKDDDQQEERFHEEVDLNENQEIPVEKACLKINEEYRFNLHVMPTSQVRVPSLGHQTIVYQTMSPSVDKMKNVDSEGVLYSKQLEVVDEEIQGNQAKEAMATEKYDHIMACPSDPNLYHYALLPINDKLNVGAMERWLLLKLNGKIILCIEGVDDFNWLNSSVLQQFEFATIEFDNMQECYSKEDQSTIVPTEANLNKVKFSIEKMTGDNTIDIAHEETYNGCQGLWLVLDDPKDSMSGFEDFPRRALHDIPYSRAIERPLESVVYGKNLYQRKYKILRKIMLIIWGWFYKDRLKAREGAHPGQWIIDWKIAWI